MTADPTTLIHVREKFTSRARALFYARLAFLALGLLALVVPAWTRSLGLRLPTAAYAYLFIVAYHIGAGFVPVRKKGKLPAATYEESYQLEYGEATVEVHTDAFRPGDRVLIVDDVLATGGTAAATAELVRRAGGVVVGVSVLIELTFLDGRAKVPGLDVHALMTV